MDNINTGFSVINGSASHISNKTVLVLGVARGGTSMTSGVLSKLGVFMGEDLNSRYQDSGLNDCIHQNNKSRAKQIILERNQSYSIWGAKKMSAWKWNGLFRQPVYVAIFRDPIATASRRSLVSGASLWPEIAKAFISQLRLMLFLRITNKPIFIASYEKALLNPELFINGLIAFLGTKHSPENIANAVNFITPSPAEYRRSPVHYQNRTQLGFIDNINGNSVSGWGLSIEQDEPVEVKLIIDGKDNISILANLARPDVADSDPRFNKNCGFIFMLGEQTLNGGEKIEVVFTQSEMSLINSPQEFSLK